ncbi:TetR/AcrR family transcriptional regulator [Luteipulveratus sp. YIM 133132]|uniref:TetR/AcrR family transcriptional regulator n=1 Tax=Luteipulveratus flavus TaxID=3031728 RepID=UPI0023B09255|nr:TetR/AcrR family transcriptional regulator [Luteipulveratus sp. YIM 133132]MDE9364658.1 TetR/AcrR family transcriptional regulator [Luteipulveratus sp. YIM 133132]
MTTAISQRARALPPDERRAALVEATLRAIRELGAVPSTRQIAQAAGVAEGTIFRVFASKEELVDAAVAQAFDPAPLEQAVAEIAADQPLRDRLVEVASLLQRRFGDVFVLMSALGMTAPPSERFAPRHTADRHAALQDAFVDLIRPDAHRLRASPEQTMAYLRLLSFSGSHPQITHGQILTPEEIVDLILSGVLAPDHEATP